MHGWYISFVWCSCKSCGQPSKHCPGHCGHIELVSPVYNPLLFNTLSNIVQRTCFSCHHFRAGRDEVNIYHVVGILGFYRKLYFMVQFSCVLWFFLCLFFYKMSMHSLAIIHSLILIQGGEIYFPIGAHYERGYYWGQKVGYART